MAGAVDWIKLKVATFEDEKIRLIETLPEADTLLVIFFKLLLLAAKKNAGRGEVYINEDRPYTPETLAIVFNRKVQTVRLALKTFEEFRLIEIEPDGTIIICNWLKHQNVDGLDKIRLQAAERQRNRRERLKKQLPAPPMPGLLGNGDRHVTSRVTGCDSGAAASRDITGQRENGEKTEREPPTIPQGGIAADRPSTPFPEQFEQAQSWLNELFHRKRAWSAEEMHLLSQLLPIAKEDRALLTWAYRLPRSHKFFEHTKLKQEVTTLLREFNGEIDKIKSVRKTIGLPATIEQKGPALRVVDDWPKNGREAAFAIFGEEIKFPPSYMDLPEDARKKIEAHELVRSAA